MKISDFNMNSGRMIREDGTVPELYPDYEWLVQSNVRVKKAQIIFRYGDKLYRTVKNNTKFDGKNIPGEDGGKYFREVTE